MRYFTLISLVGASACVVPAPELNDYDGFTPADDPVVEEPPEEAEPEAASTMIDAQGRGIDVLVLNDGLSGLQVGNYLEQREYNVTKGGYWGDWDGTLDDLILYDAVVLLQGDGADGAALSVAADRALRDYVESGGGLIRTEWAALSAYQGEALAIDQYTGLARGAKCC